MATGNGSSSVAERAKAAPDAQESMFDREVENTTLERALEEREKSKDEKATATKQYKIDNDKVQALTSELDLQVDEIVRVGRFRLKKGVVKGGTDVQFTTGEREQLYISLL